MAITQTPRVGLNQWGAGGDPFVRAQRNDDNAALEDKVALDAQGTFADRPAPAAANRGLYYFVNAGANVGKLYRSTGAAWTLLNPDAAAVDLSPYALIADVGAALATKLDVGATAANAELLDGHDSSYFAPLADVDQLRARRYARHFLTAGT